MLRTLPRLIVLALLVIGLLFVWEQLRTAPFFSRFTQTENTAQRVVLTQITELGKLELVRYTFKDIVEHEQVKTFLPNARAVLIIEGEATGCIDLTKLTAAHLTPTGTGDTLLVKLPQPELCGWKINHDRSRIYDTDYALLDESQLISDAYRQAERQIRQSALTSGILEQTRQNAEKLLRPMLEKVAGKPVLLTYEPAPVSLQPLR